ncbi:HAD family hydrolase [Streptomyces zagrosensis]|uniref:Phosphoglycolate phosphatase-like HAD superfamily hydrolase n=1 Tax=Streptomyces zagrosensis TaxID=1042984 RepID=A0A7W9Q514_9ACTN|nr:HAD family hydrolase [Streptomyces zagrosensis]MBB5933328.1 phosphoglycolate phosphatase-like HAD superfamily hydrolase [Streptomyces zagrosensis]
MTEGLLVLWDIDHTLVETRGVGRELWATAFHEVTGVEMREQVSIDGLTEPVIVRETARLHGVRYSRKLFEEFARALGAAHLRHVTAMRERGRALPGALPLLAALADCRGVRQTVVTGNIRSAAEVKLAAFGLGRFLDLNVAAFGEDADERPGLVSRALERADVPPSRAVLLGDTRADVQGGLALGVRVIGVATGRTGVDDLTAAGASAAVADLVDTDGLLRLITA